MSCLTDRGPRDPSCAGVTPSCLQGTITNILLTAADFLLYNFSAAGFLDAMEDGSLAGEGSLEKLLEKHLPPEALAEAKRHLLGHNCGKLVAPLELSAEATRLAGEGNFQLLGATLNSLLISI